MRVVTVGALLALTGCTSLPPRSHSPWDDVTDRPWRVTSIDGERVIAGSTIELTFGSNGVMTGDAQNRFHAAYHVDGSSLTIEPVAATRAFIDEPTGAMMQEGRLFVTLQNVTRWQGALILETEDGREIVLEPR